MRICGRARASRRAVRGDRALTQQCRPPALHKQNGRTHSDGPPPPAGERRPIAVAVAGDADGAARRPRHRTKTPAWFASSRKYCGATPSSTVIARLTAIAVEVRALGTATVGPSAFGSLKNISTMTRT